MESESVRRRRLTGFSGLDRQHQFINNDRENLRSLPCLGDLLEVGLVRQLLIA